MELESSNWLSCGNVFASQLFCSLLWDARNKLIFENQQLLPTMLQNSLVTSMKPITNLFLNLFQLQVLQTSFLLKITRQK